jgi:RNAse (barnase) inhibitor barstar
MRRLRSADRWECVHFVPADEGPDPAQLEADAYFVAAIDGQALRSDDALFGALGEAFQFPDYFGDNWDALDEVLRDLEWIAPTKVVLTLDGRQGIELNRTFGRLLSAWLSAAQEWSKADVPFHLVVLIPPVSSSRG